MANEFMGRVYYPVRYRLDNADRYLLWHTSIADENTEADGVVHEGDKVPVFRTLTSLRAHAQAEGLSPVDEGTPAFFNLDVVKRWLRRKRPARLDCQAFLNAWNLLADISTSVGDHFDPDKDKTKRIYNKLFLGSNIPAITPAGKRYEPLWSGRESRLMGHVLGKGLSLLRGHVVTADSLLSGCTCG